MLIALLAGMIALQTPAVQKRLADSLLSAVNSKISGTISVGKIGLVPFKTLSLKGLLILDDSPVTLPSRPPVDTVAYAREALVSFSLRSLLGDGCVRINRVVLKDGMLALTNEGKRKNNLTRVLGIKKKEPKEKNRVILVDNIKVEDFRFRLINTRQRLSPEKVGTGINWDDLDLTADIIKGRELKINGKAISGTLDHLSVTEKCGYRADHISGRAVCRPGRSEVYDFHLRDKWTELNLVDYAMTFEKAQSFKTFTQDFFLSGHIRDSRVDMRTVAAFAPGVPEMEIPVDIAKVSFNGPINSLKVYGLDFKSGQVDGNVSASWSNLMNLKNLTIDTDIRRLNFTTSGLDEVLSKLLPGKDLGLGQYARNEHFNFIGRVKGPGNRLNVSGKLNSGNGCAETSMTVLNVLDKNAPIRLSGKLGTEALDLGRILNLGFIHEVTMSTLVDASLEDSPSLSVDSLRVDRLELLDYGYSNIAAAGKFSGSAFDGRVICSDPNLNFLFQGIFNLSSKTRNAIYKFYFNLGYADLNALNIDRRGTSKASLSLNANFMRVMKGDIIGDINVKGLRLENDEGMHDIGNISISSHASDDINRMNLNSSFAEATYVGSKPVIALVEALKETTVRRTLPSIDGMAGKWKGDSYRFSLKFNDTRDLLSFVMPGLYVAGGTTLKSTITNEGRFSAGLVSQRLAFKDKYLKDLSIIAEDISDTVRLKSSEMSISGIRLLNESICLHTSNDRIDLRADFDNGSGSLTRGRIHLTGDMSRDSRDSLIIGLKALPTEIHAKGEKWQIHPSELLLNGRDLLLKSFSISCGNQTLSAVGGFSKSHADTLIADMNNLDIITITKLTGKSFPIEGKLTGRAVVMSSTDEGLGLDIDAYSDSTLVSGRNAGKLKLSTGWVDSEKKLNFRVANDLDGKGLSTVEARGYMFPAQKNLNAKISLNGFDLGYAGGFVKGILSEIGGRLNGEITIAGPLDRPSLYSRGASVNDAMIRVEYTNVPYYLNGPFHVASDGIYLDDVQITDRFTGRGTVSGGLRFDRLRDIRFDTRMSLDRMEAYNAPENSASAVYGNISCTGEVALTGPLSNLILDVNASTQGNGSIHIPLNNMNSSSSTNLLTFKEFHLEEEEDPYEVMMKRIAVKDKKKGRFGIRLRINANPEVECSLEIDKESGNVLTGRGYGSINMDILSNRPFTINGDYSLNSGNFHFNAMGLTSRDFGIRSGSSIKFNGDLMDSDLDIEATYTTKASLSNLIADTTSVSMRRAVECGLLITEKLRNPKLNFTIDIPDLDPSTKSLADMSLNTEDKIQKQFIALLVTNNFLPGDQSGIVNNSNMLFSNVTEIMAGQLSNILQKLDIPLDLGLKYQPNEGGTDIFDVAVSTQLFNNRVNVNGNFGNRQYVAGSSAEDMAGDLDIEIKLDKAGAVRMSLFSHSADQYTNYLDNTQRNGIGIGYQKEFNKLSDFLRNLFRKRDSELQRHDRLYNERCIIKIGEDE